MPVNRDANYYSALSFFCQKIKEHGGVIVNYYDMRVGGNFIEYTFSIGITRNPKYFNPMNVGRGITALFEKEKMLENGVKLIKFVKNTFAEAHVIIRFIKDGWKQPEVIIDSSRIEKMSGAEFEEYLIKILQSNQIRIERTKTSGDQGVDIIVYFNNNKTAIQCKRYSGSIGNNAVQEVFAGSKFYDAQKCMVVTNSIFTKSAIDLAKKCGVHLIDKFKLVDFLKFPKQYL